MMTLMKKFSTIWIILGVAAALGLCGCQAPRTGAKKVIRLCHSHPADSSSEIHTAALIFQKYVNDHSNTLEVKIYPANALGEERDVYEGIQFGSGVTCIISGTAILNNFNRKIGVLDLPYLWKNYDHVHRILDGEVGRIIAKDLEKSGLKALVWMDSWGYRNIITSKKDVRTPSDMRGLKIRTIQSPVYVEAINSMGANATPMALGEVYSSIQTGVLDGFEHSATIVKANKYYEVCKHIALTRHCFGPLVFVYSKREWDKLTDKEKEIVMAGALLARDQERKMGPVQDAEATAFLKKIGVKINEIDTTGFRKKALALQDKIAAERGATSLLKMIRAAE